MLLFVAISFRLLRHSAIPLHCRKLSAEPGKVDLVRSRDYALLQCFRDKSIIFTACPGQAFYNVPRVTKID